VKAAQAALKTRGFAAILQAEKRSAGQGAADEVEAE
jgi:hypothetical protein